ncbi:uncharacterized protein LOC141535282 [Cotesia typhae]|uniref:uncharacterized protein LOC141535282 n=1 Tax=Cotesia typhae TaxID=2053667 RepID=UPI003D69B92C
MSSITSSESKASSHASLESLILDPLTETLASDTISSHQDDIVSSPSPEPLAVTPASSPPMAKPSLTPEEATQLTFGRIPRPLAVQPGTVTIVTAVTTPAATTLTQVASSLITGPVNTANQPENIPTSPMPASTSSKAATKQPSVTDASQQTVASAFVSRLDSLTTLISSANS